MISVEDISSYYKENKDVLIKSLVRRAGSHEDAEDIVQETFYRALKYRHTQDECRPLEGWVVRIVQNCLKDFWNKQKGFTFSIDEPAWEHRLKVEDKNSWVIDKILKSGSFREEVREFVKYYYKFGLTYRDIRDLTGHSLNKINKLKEELVSVCSEDSGV